MSKLFESKNKILDLIKSKPMTASQISEKLGLGQSTVNQHVKELLRLGAIREIDNPYSRKWKYYEYNRSFEKSMEDHGYNMAKIRTIGMGIIALAVIAVIILVINGDRILVPPNIPSPNATTTQAVSGIPTANAFVVQLSDPPLVPSGTNSLVIYYSSIGILYKGSSTFKYFAAEGSANLLNLTNSTQTIAVLNISDRSNVSAIRLNVSSAYITIDNSTYNVTVPSGQIDAGINGTYNSSVKGTLLSLNPTIVRIYSQTNQSIFVMVPNVKAIFIGDTEVGATAVIGHIEKISPVISRILQSNSSIEITNATIMSEGNATAISIGVRNTGKSTVNLTSMQLEGYMEEIMLGYQGYPASVGGAGAGVSIAGTGYANGKACIDAECIGTGTATAISAGSSNSNQSRIEISDAADFAKGFNNYLNFLILKNGSMELPILDYARACPEPEAAGIGLFIRCSQQTGLSIAAGSGATLSFSGAIRINRFQYQPQSESQPIPVLGGSTEILLIPNQSYYIRVIGIGQNESGVAHANYGVTDNGNISAYTSQFVGVSAVYEHAFIGSSIYGHALIGSNYTLGGFTSRINGITNYTIYNPSIYGAYTLESASILTPGFTLLGITNITEHVPGECPVCTGHIKCLVCIAGRNVKFSIMRIKAPDYGYYGPLSIYAVYSANTNESTNTTITNMTTTTVQQTNQSGYGTVAGKVSIGPLCPVQMLNGTCAYGLNASSIYSLLEIRLTSLQDMQSYTISLNSNGSFSQSVSAGTYSVSMLNCNYMGCKSIQPDIVTVSAGETSDLNININTGIA